MTDARRAILTYLRLVPAADAQMIADDLALMGNQTVTRDEVQTVLHGMDDDGDVLMRNGVYRISERARAEL